MFKTWWNSYWGRSLLIGVPLLLLMAVISILHDPFDFDDRPHIQRLMKLALTDAEADATVDMEERMWAQVKFAGSLSPYSMSEHDWDVLSRSFLAHNPGYLGIFWLDRTYHLKRETILVKISSLDVATDFLTNVSLQRMLETAAASKNQVAVASRELSDGRPGYLIGVPDFVEGEVVGFVVVIADMQASLASMLSEFKNLGYSVAVSDDFRQLYQTGIDESDNRKTWGQKATVPLPGVNWQVEVWPKPELLLETRSPLIELVSAFTALLIILLISTVHFARLVQSKSKELQRAHDDLEHRVHQRTTDLEKTNEALKGLSAHVLHVQDEERRRIARDLHDSTVQALTALKINLSTLLKSFQADGRQASMLLQDSSELAEQAVNEIRTISHLLHPPDLDDFGLESALTWYTAGFSERTGIRLDLDLDPELGRCPHQVELVLYRIVQESLGNIHRHSGSPTAKVSLVRSSKHVLLSVSDEGRGLPNGVLDPKSGASPRFGVGIAGMRERVRQLGGTLEIFSTIGGTSVKAVLPIAEELLGAHESI